MSGGVLSLIEVAAVFKRWQSADWSRGANRVPDLAALRETARDPMWREVVMCIDIVFGGSVGGVCYRVATVPWASQDAAGVDHSAVAALVEEPSLSLDYNVGEGASSARSVTITLDARVIRPMDLLRSGVFLSGIAEVSLEMRNPAGGAADYDNRIVLIRGLVDGARFGAVLPASLVREASATPGPRELLASEIFEVEIVDPRDITQTKLPPWIIDSDGIRFATPHESAIGARFPVVLNGYTHIPAVRTTNVPVGGNDFLFAYGTGFAVDAATGVAVNGVTYSSGDAVYAWVLFEGIDGVSTPYSAIRFTVGGTAWAVSDAVHVIATRADNLRVIDAIRTLCSDYSAFGESGINQRMFSESATRIAMLGAPPQVLVNSGASSSETTAIDLIEQGICASYPMISMAFEDGGYGPIVTDFRLAAVADLVVGTMPLLKRTSLVQASNVSEIQNEFTLRYAYDPLLDVYARVVTRGAANSDVCAYSRALVGQRDAGIIESPYIFDDASANYVVDWMVAHFAQPSYLVEYDAVGSAMLTLRRGDPVTLTDAEFGWVRQSATIDRIDYQRGHCAVTLRVWMRLVDVGGAALSVAG